MTEYAGFAALAVSALYALHFSWRRWPDPLIDAGHQLYTAWRLSEGAVLYRDVGSLYGPLSSHVNALLFRVFGAGMMVLVWANLLVYATIVTLAYRLFRAVYGVGGALAALAVFISIFSFNQLVPVGNYNYALPYAHESTHGFTVALALIALSGKWTMQGRRAQALGMGLLCGLAFVLKPEFMLVSFVVVGTALLLRLQRKHPPGWVETALFGLAAATPMLLFTIWFWRHLALGAAFRAANQAWWTVLVTRVHAQVWNSFLGTDAPAHNLAAMLVATGILVIGAGAMWLGARRMARGSLFSGLLVPLPCVIALAYVDWMQAAWCIPLALLVVLASRTVKLWRGTGTPQPADEAQVLGLLLAVSAAALLARMSLHPRLYHFGFYQAALATMIVVAELLAFLRGSAGQHKAASLVILASTALVIAAACLGILLRSQHLYSLRTYPVAEGRDRFLCFSPDREPSGFLVGKLVEELRRAPVGDQVLVIPEGLMINYLARRQSPLAEWIFIDLTLAGSAEARLVEKLVANPPAHVVLISRDLREHGIARFGATGQPGQQLLELVRRNYRPRFHLGGDPLDPNDRGAMLLARAM